MLKDMSTVKRIRSKTMARHSIAQIPKTIHKTEKQQHNELSATNDNENLDGTYTICTGMTPTSKSESTMHHHLPHASQHKFSASLKRQPQQQLLSGARRFVNVDKFINQSSTKSSRSLNQVPSLAEEPKHGTPLSRKSLQSYSHKSTASAKSTNDSVKEEPKRPAQLTKYPDLTLPTQTENPPTPVEIKPAQKDAVDSASTPLEVLQVEDIDGNNESANIAEEDLNNDVEAHIIQRNDSQTSIHSKTESIKTQLEDTPTTISRTQSNKSLIIEEEIEDGNSFMVVEEDLKVQSVGKEQENQALPPTEELEGKPNGLVKSRPSSVRSTARVLSRSPPSADSKILSRRESMVKSVDSLYDRPISKQDSLDNTTETSSQSSQINTGTVLETMQASKTQHTPLKYKSKTSHFLRSRRISPVKQSIKMVQTELFPGTLTKFDKPREALAKTFRQLDETNWEMVIQGLKSLVRLIRYHLDYLDTQMHMTCIQLTRTVRNLRSQVARAACQVSTELFASRSKNIEQECDDLVCALLNRTADTNKFLRADTTRALEVMCDSFSSARVLNLLTSKGATHHNALIRTTTAKLFNRLVERLGYEKIFAMSRDNRDKFILTMANFLLEGSLETRSYAKSVFRALSEYHGYNRVIIDTIPARIYRNIEKSLKSIANPK